MFLDEFLDLNRGLSKKWEIKQKQKTGFGLTRSSK